MSDATPTRSAVLEMKDERRAMHDGYVFLDEKCLLLAGEILRELARHAVLRRAFESGHRRALAALRQAVARHGLDGLAAEPGADLGASVLAVERRSLMGVSLQRARFTAAPATVPASADASPELAACRRAFGALLAPAAELAAIAGNLERLSAEYRRAVRRARALHDVLLPELDRQLAEAQGRLEEGEQEDAIWMRQRPRAAATTARTAPDVRAPAGAGSPAREPPPGGP